MLVILAIINSAGSKSLRVALETLNRFLERLSWVSSKRQYPAYNLTTIRNSYIFNAKIVIRVVCIWRELTPISLNLGDVRQEILCSNRDSTEKENGT